MSGNSDLQLDLPQLLFRPDRLRIANANLSTADVALAVNMLTSIFAGVFFLFLSVV